MMKGWVENEETNQKHTHFSCARIYLNGHAKCDYGFVDLGNAQRRPDAVNYVGNNGIMAGKGGGYFAPKDGFTIQESITVFDKMG